MQCRSIEDSESQISHTCIEVAVRGYQCTVRERVCRNAGTKEPIGVHCDLGTMLSTNEQIGEDLSIIQQMGLIMFSPSHIIW